MPHPAGRAVLPRSPQLPPAGVVRTETRRNGKAKDEGSRHGVCSPLRTLVQATRSSCSADSPHCQSPVLSSPPQFSLHTKPVSLGSPTLTLGCVAMRPGHRAGTDVGDPWEVGGPRAAERRGGALLGKPGMLRR